MLERAAQRRLFKLVRVIEVAILCRTEILALCFTRRPILHLAIYLSILCLIRW